MRNISSLLGNLSGDRERVQWNPLDFILLMIKGITTTLSAPNIDWQVEMTPVDFVSAMIVKMTQVEILINVDLYLWLFQSNTLGMYFHKYACCLFLCCIVCPLVQFRKCRWHWGKFSTSLIHSL